jgi:hypothetical protein
VRPRHILLFHLNQASRPISQFVIQLWYGWGIWGDHRGDIWTYHIDKAECGINKEMQENSVLLRGSRAADELSDKTFERSVCSEHNGFPMEPEFCFALYIATASFYQSRDVD